ncbi:unnamed protein product [Trichobilharzia regenti]|nr:unnamed protein product [Trichobilharzia regenti]
MILHDVPENTDLGIDMKFWKVGRHFKGIKDIPLGVHSVYYSAVNSDCMSGQRIGFIANFTQPGFIVKRWRREEEGNLLLKVIYNLFLFSLRFH